MPTEWERRHEAFKAIHDKLADVLAKLDSPSDPQTVAIISSVVLSILVGKRGTPYSNDITSDDTVIAADPDKKIKVYDIFIANIGTVDSVVSVQMGANVRYKAKLGEKGIWLKTFLGPWEGADNEALAVNVSASTIHYTIHAEQV